MGMSASSVKGSPIYSCTVLVIPAPWQVSWVLCLAVTQFLLVGRSYQQMKQRPPVLGGGMCHRIILAWAGY